MPEGQAPNLLDRVVKWTELAAAVLLVLLTVVVFGEVLSRYVFRTPLVFSNELSLLLFPWFIFVAAVVVTKEDAHLSVTYFRDRLPEAMQKGLYLFSKLLMLTFSIFMVISSSRFVSNVSDQLMPVLRISRSWLSLSVTVSFILISIILLYQIYCIATNRMTVPREEDAFDDLDHDR